MSHRESDQRFYSTLNLDADQRAIWDAYGDGDMARVNGLWKRLCERQLGDNSTLSPAVRQGLREALGMGLEEVTFELQHADESMRKETSSKVEGQDRKMKRVFLPPRYELERRHHPWILLLLLDPMQYQKRSHHFGANIQTRSAASDVSFVKSSGLLFPGLSTTDPDKHDLTDFFLTLGLGDFHPFCVRSINSEVVDASTLPAYQYSDLSANETLRLLHLGGSSRALSDGSRQTVCRLETFALDEAPEYRTLSYAWGCPTWDELEDDIWTRSDFSWILDTDSGRRKLSIRRNLFDALKQISTHSKSDSWIWIDAICIDQDNLDERSKQVQIMGKIFSKCKRVLIWLGGLDPLDAAKMYSLHVNLLPQIKSYVEENGEDSIVARSWTLNDLDAAGMKVPIEHLQIFEKFLRNARWFSRVWTRQEIVLAPQATVLLAHLNLPFLAMRNLSWFFGASTLLKHFVPNEHSEESRDIVRRTGMHPIWLLDALWTLGVVIRAPDDESCARSLRVAGLSLDLSSPFEVFFHMLLQPGEATDPRDHCYAALGVAEHSGTPIGVTTDYHRTTARVFEDITVLGLKRLPRLALLGATRVGESRVTGLPSWVIDFSKPISTLDPRIYEPSLYLKSPSKIEIRESKLVLEGARLWQISRTCRFSDVIQGPAALFSDKWVNLMNFLSLLLAVEHHTEECDVYEDDPLEVLWRTVTMDDARKLGVEQFNNEMFREALACTMLQFVDGRTKSGALDFGSVEKIRSMFPDSELMPSTTYLQDLGRSFSRCNWPEQLPTREDIGRVRKAEASTQVFKLMASRSFCSNSRCLYITEPGFVGIGPSTMRETDCVVWIKGACKLFILRPKGDEYTMVGETYVHGAMHGEYILVQAYGKVQEAHDWALDEESALVLAMQVAHDIEIGEMPYQAVLEDLTEIVIS